MDMTSGRLDFHLSSTMAQLPVLDFEGLTEEMAMSMDARLSMEHTDALGHVVFTCHAWRRLFEIKGPLVRELMLEFFSTCRVIASKGNPRGYWDEISSSGDFLTTVPSYIQIMDSLRRFCYRLITYTITGRGQTPKKKATVVVRELIEIDLDELSRLHIWCPAIDEGVQAVPAPVQVLQPPPLDVVRTMPQRMTRLEEEVHGLRKSFGEQREILDTISRDFSRFTTWMVDRLSQLLDASGMSYTSYGAYQIPYHRRTR
ncbi:hypothetical protein Tco_0531057 [Tanacetum coccineum]